MSGYQRVNQRDEPQDAPPASAAAPSAPPSAAAPFSLAALFSPAPRQAAAAAAAHCAATLRSQYGAHVPDFQGLGFEEAMVTGQRTSRPVLVYLQSDLHGDTDDFLRGALCTPEVCEVVRSVGYVAWAGRVHEPSGWEASLKLEATGFPFLAVFMPQAGSSSSGGGGGGGARTTRSVRVWSMEGGTLPSAAALVADLRRWGSQARGVLEEASQGRRALESARSREREMRETQEREYRAAEAADAARERERAAAAAAAAEAQRQQAEAAAAAEDAQELELAMRLSMRSDVEECLAAARSRLAASPEPAAGAAVRMQLPTGVKLQRRFPPSAPLSLLVDYVVVSSVDLGQGLDPGSFDLATTHPRRTWNTHAASAAQGSEAGVTLEAAGLAGAVVLVQPVAPGRGGGGQ